MACVGPSPLSPQDCVQLNQYKLKDEIGKVNIGRVLGWDGWILGREGVGLALAFQPVRRRIQPLATATRPAPRCDAGLFWVVPIELYGFF